MARNSDPNAHASVQFPSTHWSLIVKAGSPGSPQARAALADLCSAYWYPIYAFIRRKGNGPDQALDLTQGFFARLLERRYHRGCQPRQGPIPRVLAHRLPALLDRPFPSNDSVGRRDPDRFDRCARRGGPLSLRTGRHAHTRPPVRSRLGPEFARRGPRPAGPGLRREGQF